MISTTKELTDPDVFSTELHHWLLIEGPRSANVRRLWRLARKESGAELERIFETMVAEAKRAKRESRKPSLWNLPVRSVEWLCEHARFTPPREVVSTLFYVGVVIFGVEFAKDRFFSTQTDELLTNTLLTSTLTDSYDDGARADGFSQSTDAANRVDQWFSEEVAAAMDRILDSDQFKQKLRRVVIESIDVEIADAIARASGHEVETAAPAAKDEAEPEAESKQPAVSGSPDPKSDQAVMADSETLAIKID